MPVCRRFVVYEGGVAFYSGILPFRLIYEFDASVKVANSDPVSGFHRLRYNQKCFSCHGDHCFHCIVWFSVRWYTFILYLVISTFFLVNQLSMRAIQFFLFIPKHCLEVE